jgi:hypothetical protein
MFTLGASGKKNRVSMSYNYQPVALSTEHDGSIVMRVWGEGRNRSEAVQQAHKDAVYVVMFKGVSFGKNVKPTKQLVFDRRAEEKHKSFFNDFFAEDGPYTQFVSDENTPTRKSDKKQKSAKQERWEVTVKVLRTQLEQYLVDEDIITSDNAIKQTLNLPK